MRRLFFIFFCLSLFSASFGNIAEQVLNVLGTGQSFELYSENGKVGLKDNVGNIVIPAKHDRLGWSNGEFSVVNNVTGYQSNGLWGLINLNNNIVVKAEYEDLSPGDASTIIARKKIPGTVKVLAGCISPSGKEIVPFQYDGLRIASFRAIVYNRAGTRFRHGLIDLHNKVLIPLNYQNIYPLGSLRYRVENFENKSAIFSEDGKQLTDFSIDSLSKFQGSYAILYEGIKEGLIDRQGAIKLPPALCDLSLSGGGEVKIRRNDSWLFLNGENKAVQEMQADSIFILTDSLLKIKTKNVFQLLNRQLQPIDSEVYSHIGKFSNGKALVVTSGKTGLINSRGDIIIQPEHNALIADGDFVRANKRIYDRNRWVLLNSNGKTIGTKNYEFIGPFNGKFFPVKNRGFWGALNTEGEEIISCVHDSILQEKGDRVAVKFRGSYGVIDLDENWTVPPQKNRIEILSEDRYFLETPATKFFKSFKGEIIYFSSNPLRFEGTHLTEQLPSGEIWKISNDGQIVDRSVKPPKVEIVLAEHEGLRAIRKDGMYGFVDSQGRLRIANRYEDANFFSESMAAVKIRGRWGFINRQDQIAIQPVYDEVGAFKNGTSIVKQNNLYGLVDSHGKLMLPVRYESIVALEGRRFKVRENGLWGLSDQKGMLIIHTKFDTLEDLNNGYVIVSRNQKFGLITLQGISTIPEMYDGLTFDKFHNQFIAHKKSFWETVRL